MLETPPEPEPPEPEPPELEPPPPEPPEPEPPLPGEPPEPLPPSPDVPPAPLPSLGPEQEARARARLVTRKALRAEAHCGTATTPSVCPDAAARREADGNHSRVGVICEFVSGLVSVDRKDAPEARRQTYGSAFGQPMHFLLHNSMPSRSYRGMVFARSFLALALVGVGCTQTFDAGYNARTGCCPSTSATRSCS